MKFYAKSFLVLMSVMSVVAVMSSETLAKQQPPKGGDPMEAVAAALGLNGDQMKTCGPSTPPSPGARPSDADHAALISCLQGLDSSLTVEKVDAAMEAMKQNPPPSKN